MRKRLNQIRWHLSRILNPEAAFWAAGLITLAMIDPVAKEYFSVCPLRAMGFQWCPGCGLGRSISLILHGNFAASWHVHPLGGFALTVLIHRIVVLQARLFRVSRMSIFPSSQPERTVHGQRLPISA